MVELDGININVNGDSRELNGVVSRKGADGTIKANLLLVDGGIDKRDSVSWLVT